MAIIDNGETIVYTPPADYNGSTPDTFNYVVADVPGAGQLSEAAVKQGSVMINFRPVNDPPRTTDDNYTGQEDEPVIIPIVGDGTTPGILDNDLPGPADEVSPPQNQTISLVPGQFPKTTSQGGTVTLEGNSLRYTPPSLFSGVDVFQYSVRDNLGEVATANVSINVGGVNNAPLLCRNQRRSESETSITVDESKAQPEQDWPTT